MMQKMVSSCNVPLPEPDQSRQMVIHLSLVVLEVSFFKNKLSLFPVTQGGSCSFLSEEVLFYRNERISHKCLMNV